MKEGILKKIKTRSDYVKYLVISHTSYWSLKEFVSAESNFAISTWHRALHEPEKVKDETIEILMEEIGGDVNLFIKLSYK